VTLQVLLRFDQRLGTILLVHWSSVERSSPVRPPGEEQHKRVLNLRLILDAGSFLKLTLAYLSDFGSGEPPSQFCIAALPGLCHTAIKGLPRSMNRVINCFYRIFNHVFCEAP
jgi:hypothetical protein